MKYEKWSWGNYPSARHNVFTMDWPHLNLPGDDSGRSLLPYGYGRSYGDVPVNDQNSIIRTGHLDRFVAFDQNKGIIKCESGVPLFEILKVIIPHGWYLPVAPGTQIVSIGGAIANDIHGKNHHSMGTIGRHVIGFELLRSDIGRIWCSRESNYEYFSATIGGIGLTGLIVNVELKLKRIFSTSMDVVSKAFNNIEEGLSLFAEFDQNSSYTVAWIDCTAKASRLGRGVFSRAEHCEDSEIDLSNKKSISVPFYFPGFVMNKWSISAFNHLYFERYRCKTAQFKQDFRSFFFPLDSIQNWNRMYGKNGFFQYQCVIPSNNASLDDSASKAVLCLLQKISGSGQGSFLAVLKTFGQLVSPGMLSFPTQGVTIALDFPNNGHTTLALLKELDSIVKSVGGRIYPAKDARMPSSLFKESYPLLDQFSSLVDPCFSSSFWRRVFEEGQ